MRFPLLLALLISGCTSEMAADEPAAAAAQGPDNGGSTADPTTASPAATAGSTSSWTNQPIAAQGSSFSLVLAAVPSAAEGAAEGAIDAVIGLSDGEAAAFSDLGPIVRFNPAGTFDVRDGATYRADAAVAYQSGQTYQVWFDIDVAQRRYSVQVAANGGPPTRIASGYAFRTEQAGMAQIDNVAHDIDSAGSISVYGAEVVHQPAL
jgi:hypothetical protein